MKNKKLTYILIPLVLILWGAIIYRVFNTIGGNDGAQTIASLTLSVESKKEFAIDTFALKLHYRDPFLGKTTANRSENSEPGKATVGVTIPKVVVIAATTVWPSITYGGLIKNKNSDKQLAFVQINGAVNIMKVGDVINEITITKILKDSIEVQFGKQKRFIAR